MEVGSFKVELLSEGRFEIFSDGYINRMSESAKDFSRTKHSMGGQPNIVGINPVLVQTERHNILLDTGLGWGLDEGSSYDEVSNICSNLAIFELQPEDITHVVLSHLHYDHAAGCSFTNADFTTESTFPNARYCVHEAEWQHAQDRVNANQKQVGIGYQLDEFYRLVGNDQIEFLDKDTTEIVPGITIIRTGGHTPGHQIVQIESNDEQAYYLGDLVPSSDQLNYYATSGIDVNPVQAKKEKVQLLKKACDEKALLFFYHSKYGQVGSLIQDEDEKFVLADLSKDK